MNYDYSNESNINSGEFREGTAEDPEHEGKRVDSRAVLKDTLTYVKKELMDIFQKHPTLSGLEHINGKDVADIQFTSATELEFWVKTPLEEADIEEMSASQVLQEQYWQRTHDSS